VTQRESQNIVASEINNDEIDMKINYPDLKSTVIVFFVFILNTVITATPVGLLMIGLNRAFPNSPLLKSSLNLMMYIVILLITIKYVIKKSKERQGYFLRISFKKIQVWLVPVVMVGTLALIIPLAQVSNWIPMPKSVQKLFEMVFKKDVFSIFTLVFAAPILEEMLCRGIILRGLLKNYPPQKAILISAIFFGAVHLNPWQAAPAFLSGLFLGWVYYKTQSVIPGMIIHATINISATFFLPSYEHLSSRFGTSYQLIACFVSIIVFTATCIIIQRKVLIIPDHMQNDLTTF
jgi:membrane protease YdiL (CAAX protease family)